MSEPQENETVEDYLRKYAVLDGHGNMDGEFVPLSVAHLAVELYVKDRLELKRPSWRTHDI